MPKVKEKLKEKYKFDCYSFAKQLDYQIHFIL